MISHSSPPERLLYIWDIADLVSLDTALNPIRQADGMPAGRGTNRGSVWFRIWTSLVILWQSMVEWNNGKVEVC